MQLKNHCWYHSVHEGRRALCWKVVLGYLPPYPHVFEDVLKIKRGLYTKYLYQHVSKLRDGKILLENIHTEMSDVVVRIPVFRDAEILALMERAIFVACQEHHDMRQIPVGFSNIAIPITNALIVEKEFGMRCVLS